MEIEWDDVPCYEITVKFTVTGDTVERARDFLDECFQCINRAQEREVWNWEFVDLEEA